MTTSKEQLPIRIAKLHNFFSHLGKPGRKFTQWLSLYSLYVIFTNGGVEALAVICHEYILREVKERTYVEQSPGTTSSANSSSNQNLSRV